MFNVGGIRGYEAKSEAEPAAGLALHEVCVDGAPGRTGVQRSGRSWGKVPGAGTQEGGRVPSLHQVSLLICGSPSSLEE